MKYQHDASGSDFSFTDSGLFHKLLAKLGMDSSHPHYLAKRSFWLAATTWIPLAILSALQGLLFGDKVKVPFLYDVTTHLRFLVVIPMLIFAERTVDLRLKELMNQFFKSGIILESDKPVYMSIRARSKKLAESIIPDIVMIFLIVANLTIRWKTSFSEDVTFWMKYPDGNDSGLSWAGAYLLFFSLPVVQFILLRWLWRWVIWFIFFIGISKMPLQLRASHADEAGGIGFLGMPPGPFIPVTLALATIFSAAILEQVIFFSHKLPEYYITMGAFIFIAILLNILPMIVFIKPLVTCRRRALFDYGALIHQHHQQFDDKWINTPEPGSILGNPDASSATDINSVFQTVKSMKVVPFDIKTMVSGIVISILPMLPLFVLQYSVAEIFQKVIKLLI